MLKNKFNRHAFAFLTVSLASVLLYPTAHNAMELVTWILLGLVLIAALTTLLTK